MNDLGGNRMKVNVKMSTYTHNGEEKSFNFYTSLRAMNKLKFVNIVTDLVIGDNYNSVIRDMMFDFAIVEVFTDIDTSAIHSSSNSIEMIEDLLDETNIVDIVKANAEYGLIEELNKAVDDNIEYRTGVRKNPIAESLSHLLNTIEQKMSGIDTESMMQFAEIISSMSGELTTDKMLEAYSKSNMFKDRYAQILSDKEQHNVKMEAIADMK